ncbi:MAG: hypothetical protein AAGJ93_05360, partial [Bacteroidota bacterium]
YLFSSLMQEIYQRLFKALQQNNGQILAPLPPSNFQEEKPPFGAGVFPDRLFALAGSYQPHQLTMLIDAAIDTIAHKALPHPTKEQLKMEENGKTVELQFIPANFAGAAKQFWRDYFRVVQVWKTLEPSEDNILLELNSYLDTAELQPSYQATAPATDFALALLDYPYQTKFASALYDRGTYAGVMPSRSLFPSTAEVAALELFKANSEAAQTLLYKNPQQDGPDEQDLNRFYEQIGQTTSLSHIAADYHKYYCIVHADGDSFSKILNTFSGSTQHANITHFSKLLADFSVVAAKTIDQFGGKPVYIGGDDLLFFVPLRTERIQTSDGTGVIGSVFELLQQLDIDFQKHFTARLSLPTEIAPSLSYGISIAYYKYPLFEAHRLSFDQLKDQAKKYRDAKQQKDAVAFRLLKHSGSYFQGVITKDQLGSLSVILNMMDDIPEMFFSSIAFKLDTLKALLNELLRTQSLTATRLQALFENFFDEPVHRANPDALQAIHGLVLVLFSQQEQQVDGEAIDPTKNLYAILRLLMFMVSNRNQKITSKTEAHV